MPMAGRPLPLPHSHGHQADGAGRAERAPSRLRTAAASAWSGTRRGVENWIRRDDNGLMLLTALVACVLILVIASVGK
jgi:hypothetical protein